MRKFTLTAFLFGCAPLLPATPSTVGTIGSSNIDLERYVLSSTIASNGRVLSNHIIDYDLPGALVDGKCTEVVGMENVSPRQKFSVTYLSCDTDSDGKKDSFVAIRTGLGDTTPYREVLRLEDDDNKRKSKNCALYEYTKTPNGTRQLVRQEVVECRTILPLSVL